jgi:hypothetical protein
LLKSGGKSLPPGGSLAQFAAYYNCSRPPIVNPQAGSLAGLQAAQLLADDVCRVITDCGACAQQLGCGWLNGACMAFWTLANGDVAFARAATCPAPCSALVTGVSQVSQCPSFCASLSSQGCRAW